MKLLFINISIRPDAAWKQFPVGLGYVMTAVKDAGFDFDFLDIDINSYSDQYVENFIAKNTYDVIAFGTIVTHYRWSKWLINTIKEHQPQCTVIVGNSVGESIPEIIFAKTPVDVVVLGEGDVTIVEVLGAIDKGAPLGRALEPEVPVLHINGSYPAAVMGEGVAGICFRDDKNRVVNTGKRKAVRILDDIPFPDWDIIEADRYIQSGSENFRGRVWRYESDEVRPMPITTARGCVFKCTFCHYTFWDDPYRHRSPENVIAEIKQNQKKYGANYFNFWDDLSFHKLGPAEKFLDALIEADLGIHFTAAIRSDLLGRSDIPRDDRVRVAGKFREAGAVVLGYSLESANDEILESMNKRVKAEYFDEQVTILREVGDVVSLTSLVFGYPEETPETIAQTMQKCLDLRVYPSPGFVLPLPSTGMWKYALDNGLIKDPDEFLTNLTERQDIVINMTKSMSDEDLFNHVTDGLQNLSDALELGFKDGSLLRTGGFQKHGKSQVKDLKPHADLKPILNYADMEGGM